MSREFQTSDIVLAAFLKAKGFKLEDIIRTGNKGTFVFENVDFKIVELYDLGESLIEPKSLHNEIKSLTTAARRGTY